MTILGERQTTFYDVLFQAISYLSTGILPEYNHLKTETVFTNKIIIGKNLFIK